MPFRDETMMKRRFIRMRANGIIRNVRERADAVATAAATVRPYAQPERRRCGRPDPGVDRAGVALARAMASRHPPRLMALPDHAESLDRHRPCARAKREARGP